VTFRGDVDQIPIANIVQALFLNGQEGVLTVDSGTIRRKFRILKLGIRPLMNGSNDLSLLERALIKERLLNETQFQNAISTWDSSTLFPGDFLLRRRVISSDDVEHGIRKQLEESIYEVLTARDLRYEFSAGDVCLDHEIFDPEGLGTTLIYSVNGVLMEAVRREDEWRRIEEEVPTGYEIYVPVKKGLPSAAPADIDLAESHYKQLAPLLTGDRSVERIVADSVLSRYEVYNGLYQLKSRGYIRRLRLSEKEGLADKLRRLVRNKEAIDVYRSILDESPDNLRTRIQLIFLLEKGAHHPSLLIEHYLALFEHFESEDSAKAESYIEKILSLDPDNLTAFEKLFTLHAMSNNRSGALTAVRALLKSVKKTERYQDGAELLMRIVNYYPDELSLYHELADLLIASNQNDMAVGCLKTAADLYERAGDRARLLKTYELIVRIDPSESGKLKKLAGETKRELLTTSDIVRLSLITVALAVVGTIGAFFLLIEVDSRSVYADTERMVHVQLKYDEFGRARATLMDFLNSFWFSTKKKPARALFAQIEHLEKSRVVEQKKLESEQSRILSSALAKALQHMSDGEYGKARQILQQAIDGVSDHDLEAKQAAQLRRVESALKEVDTYLTDAKKLLAESRAAIANRDIATAHRAALELIEDYPHSPLAQSAKIPVLIDSVPPDATVEIRGKKYANTTPLVLSAPPVPRMKVTLSKVGYRSDTFSFNPRTTYHLIRELEKLPLWIFDSHGPIDGFPIAHDNIVFFGNRDGRIFCLNEEGKKKWREVSVHMDISGGLGFWNNILYVGNFEGNVFLINASTGTLRGTGIKATPASLPIKEAPSRATRRGVAAFNCGNKLVAGIDLMAGGKTKWVFNPKAQLLGPPQLDNDRLYCFTVNGTLFELDPDTALRSGKPLNRHSMDGLLAQHGVVRNGRAYVGIASGEARCLDLKTGENAWTRTLPSAPTAPPTISDSGVIVLPLASGDIVCLDATSGEIKWRRDADEELNRSREEEERVSIGTIETAGTVLSSRYYVGSRGGYILCWNLDSGDLEWSFRTQGADETPPKGILCPGRTHGGYLYQGSDDGNVYCLEIRSAP